MQCSVPHEGLVTAGIASTLYVNTSICSFGVSQSQQPTPDSHLEEEEQIG